MRSRWFGGFIIVLAVFAIIYALLAIAAQPAQEHPIFARMPPRPLVIAHQGGDGLRPGNTLLAFRNAFDMGVDMLEMDMHQTSDGVLVLIHDATVDRTTDGSGEIKAMTLAELHSFDAGYDWTPDEGQSYPYRGQGIQVPTLEEVFEAFPDMLMNIEIKQVEPSIADPFCQALRSHDMTGQVLVASFSKQAIEEFRLTCPEVATSLAEDEVRPYFFLTLVFLSELYSPAGSVVQVPESSSGFDILTPRFLTASQGRNLEVHAWTINEVEAMERILALGVDGIITDYPDRLLDVLGR